MGGDRQVRTSVQPRSKKSYVGPRKTSICTQFKQKLFRYESQIGHFPKEVESFLFVKRTDPRTLFTKVTPELVPTLSPHKVPLMYESQIGHFPKEVESFLFVKRTDPRTLFTKVTPELVYPIQANRPAVPKHALLEDDWRAFRSVFHNYQSLVRSHVTSHQRLLEYVKCNKTAERIYPELAKDPKRTRTTAVVPTLALYKDSMNAPLGYVYRRYMQSNMDSPANTGRKAGKEQLKIPVLVFEGPYMDTIHIPQGERVTVGRSEATNDYDPDVIVTQPITRNTIIYNEPDAIPLSCSRTDFSLTLTQRAIKMATSIGCRALTANC